MDLGSLQLLSKIFDGLEIAAKVQASELPCRCTIAIIKEVQLVPLTS